MLINGIEYDLRGWKAIGKHLGYCRQTLINYHEQGMPVKKLGGTVRASSKQITEWYVTNKS